jgi:hypothetical protein
MADIENGLSDLDVKSNRDLQKEKTVSILTSYSGTDLTTFLYYSAICPRKFLARGLTRI